ncbi:MAG: hypothetical protein K2U26_00800 [Cyclobacteriaceae bacterium]|nr:hypothetical protein [Cyclobacteriaceae bacterium]
MCIYSYRVIAFFLCLAFQAPLTGWAQSKARADSLKHLLQSDTNTDKLTVLFELSWEMLEIDTREALGYARFYHSMSQKKGDSLNIIKSGRILGVALRRADKIDSAIVVFKSILPIARESRDRVLYATILNSLGVAFRESDDDANALNCFLEVMMISERIGNKRWSGIAYSNIALIYHDFYYYTMALEYYLKSLKVKEESSDKIDLDILFADIGLCYSQINDFGKAFSYIEKGSRHCSPKCTNNVTAMIENILGGTFKKMKNFKDARSHYERSLEFAKKSNSERDQFLALTGLGQIFLAEDKLPDAWRVISEIDELENKHQYPRQLVYLNQLKADYYAKSGDFRQANLYQRMQKEAEEKVVSVKMREDVLRIHTKMAERENLQRIEAQRKVVALREEAVQQHQSLNLALAGLVLLATGLIFTLYKINRQKQRINVVLDERVKELTRELEQHRDELRKLHEEKVIELKNVHTDILASGASLKGLTNLAFTESASVDENKKFYHDKIMEVINRLSSSITHSPG